MKIPDKYISQGYLDPGQQEKTIRTGKSTTTGRSSRYVTGRNGRRNQPRPDSPGNEKLKRLRQHHATELPRRICRLERIGWNSFQRIAYYASAGETRDYNPSVARSADPILRTPASSIAMPVPRTTTTPNQRL